MLTESKAGKDIGCLAEGVAELPEITWQGWPCSGVTFDLDIEDPDMWLSGQSFLGKGNCGCKDPEAGLCWLSVWNSNNKKDYVDRVSRKLVRSEGPEILEGFVSFC